MDVEAPPEWAQSFENKSVSELRAMVAPEGLDGGADLEWRRAKVNAIFARQDADKAAQGAAAPQLEAEIAREAAARVPARVAVVHTPLVLPQGDAAQLLERQLASGAALIAHLSDYIARNDTQPEVCLSFMDRMTAMLGASANVGKTVGRLRGQVSRTEQLINVTHGGERGRGDAKT